jgi:hypothetical protein
MSMKVTYFKFEDDFIEEGLRCIPMIVRYKLDACGVKLKLSEWSKMNPVERQQLAEMTCETSLDAQAYRAVVQHRVRTRTGDEPTDLVVDRNPDWGITTRMPVSVENKLREAGWHLSLAQWSGLAVLQRFALSKLAGSQHEGKNFKKALAEFGLL